MAITITRNLNSSSITTGKSITGNVTGEGVVKNSYGPYSSRETTQTIFIGDLKGTVTGTGGATIAPYVKGETGDKIALLIDSYEISYEIDTITVDITLKEAPAKEWYCDVNIPYTYSNKETKTVGITFNDDGSISINCTSLKVNGKTIS